MLAALKAAGCADYSIYRRDRDLFGYMVVDDFERFRATMDASPVNARWQAEMADLIDPLIDPATGFHQRLIEVFHLDRPTAPPPPAGRPPPPPRGLR